MKNAPQKAKGCRFCGNPFSISKKTEEHAPPKWLLELAGIERSEKHRLLQKIEQGNYEVVREIGAHSSVYGQVCSGCNNGWLSDLETRMKVIFPKIISEGTFTLDIHEAQTICRWMHKTAALIALGNPGERRNVVVPDDLRALYLGMLPNGEADVILGRTQNPAPSKLRIWTHAIRYGVPHAHSFVDETKDSKCFTAMLHFKSTVLGYVYRFPRQKWHTTIEPHSAEFIHLWPQDSYHEIDMASVPPIDDPEAIRFTFLLKPTQYQ